MLVSIITAPPEAPQVCNCSPQAPPVPQLDAVDRRIIEAVREHGPVTIWSMLNWLSQDEGARSRAEGRQARLDLWHHRIKRLKRLGLVFGRARNELAVLEPDRHPTRPHPRPRWRKRSVVSMPDFCGVSATSPPPMPTLADFTKQDENQLVLIATRNRANEQEPQVTETAPDQALVAQAARSLASLPRRPRRQWSGMIGRIRCYRNMPIRLPDGRDVYALGAKRGLVVFTRQADGPIGSVEGVGRDWGAIRADLTVVIKNPMAQILGSRKRGVRERKSAAKAAAARVNGSIPCAPGKRRGRPRKPIHSTTPNAHRNFPPIGPMPSTPCAMDYQTAVAFYSRPQPPPIARPIGLTPRRGGRPRNA